MATSSFLDPDPKLLQLQKHFCRFLIWDVQFFMMHVFLSFAYQKFGQKNELIKSVAVSTVTVEL